VGIAGIFVLGYLLLGLAGIVWFCKSKL